MAIYEIAFHLRMSIGQLLDLPYEELLGWMNYLERRPVDWRDDDRTFKLLQVQGYKGRPDQVFSSLAAINNQAEVQKEPGMIDFKSFKGSLMFSKMLQAQGGDKLNYD
jgi:hypothetical protein